MVIIYQAQSLYGTKHSSLTSRNLKPNFRLGGTVKKIAILKKGVWKEKARINNSWIKTDVTAGRTLLSIGVSLIAQL